MRSFWMGVAWGLGFGLLVSEGRAEAQDRYLVTFAKRECPMYTDITANKARNNLQESLEDLGADSPYLSPPYRGEPVDPTVEDLFQPACSPVTGFRFTMGEGIADHEVDFLSVVRDPYPTAITTQASVPLLDENGDPTGDTIAGAVTIELTDEQAARALRGNLLWAQEGLPSDPLLRAEFPGRYGFGALRCAIDNLNGDNVEFISYPSGTTHVFCYSYNVVPPPQAAILRVTKEIDVAATGIDETFRFCGPGHTPGAVSPSYEPDGCFTLHVQDNQPDTIEFVRAAGLLLEFHEQVPESWQPFSGVSDPSTVTCTSANGTSVGTVDTTTDPFAPTITGTLGEGDVVHCTFTNRLAPIPELVVRKRSHGKLGSFDFEVAKPSGGTDERSATTTQEGIAVEVDTWTGTGTYVVSELFPPPDPNGTWLPPVVECNGREMPVTETNGRWEVSVDVQEDTICTFDDVFEPGGRLTIQKVTEGGVGETLFIVFSLDTQDFLEVRFLVATTTEEGVPAIAVPIGFGDSLEGIRLTAFLIFEVGPFAGSGRWSLESATCDVVFEDLGGGAVLALLSPFQPEGTCTYVNRFEPAPTPTPTPPGVTPTPTPTHTPVPTPSPSPTPTPGVTPTPIPLPTPTPIVPPTPSPMGTPSPTPIPTPTPLPTPTLAPPPTPTPLPTAALRKHPWGRKSGLIGDPPNRREGRPSMRLPLGRR